MRKQKILLCFVAVVVMICILAGVMFIPRMVRSLQSLQSVKRGDTYMEAEQYEDAIREYADAINRDGKNAQAYLGLARAKAAVGAYEDAFAVLDRGVDATSALDLMNLKSDIDKEWRESVIRDMPLWLKGALARCFKVSADELTPKMMKEVETISFGEPMYFAVDPDVNTDLTPRTDIEWNYYLDVYINGSYTDSQWRNFVPEKQFEYWIDCIPEDDTWALRFFNMFYSYKNPNDKNLTDRERQEMLETFPVIEEYGPVYIFDYEANESERNLIFSYLVKYVPEFEDYWVCTKYGKDPYAVDCSAFSVMDHLKSVDYACNTSKSRLLKYYPDKDPETEITQEEIIAYIQQAYNDLILENSSVDVVYTCK